jgi:hypothetical protein
MRGCSMGGCSSARKRAELASWCLDRRCYATSRIFLGEQHRSDGVLRAVRARNAASHANKRSAASGQAYRRDDTVRQILDLSPFRNMGVGGLSTLSVSTLSVHHPVARLAPLLGPPGEAARLRKRAGRRAGVPRRRAWSKRGRRDRGRKNLFAREARPLQS